MRVDGPPIRKLDITHPALKAFEIVYVWDNSAQVDDLSLGIVTLFAITLFTLIGLCCVNLSDLGAPVRAPGVGGKGGGSGISTKRTRSVLYPNKRTKE